MIHAPTRAIDRVSPETARQSLAEYAALDGRYSHLTAEDLRDLRYRVGYAVAHGSAIVITPREAAGLLGFEPAPVAGAIVGAIAGGVIGGSADPMEQAIERMSGP